MDGIEKIVEYIKMQSELECAEIVRNAEVECRRLRAEYSKAQKDEYWKYIDSGTKEAEQRLSSLGDLAVHEANKQVRATRDEMANEAYELAAKKFSELPKEKREELSAKLGIKPPFTAGKIFAQYGKQLSPFVMSALFD